MFKDGGSLQATANVFSLTAYEPDTIVEAAILLGLQGDARRLSRWFGTHAFTFLPALSWLPGRSRCWA